MQIKAVLKKRQLKNKQNIFLNLTRNKNDQTKQKAKLLTHIINYYKTLFIMNPIY